MFSDRFRQAKNYILTLTVRSFVKWIVSALFLSFFSIYIFITSRRTESYVNFIFFCFVSVLLLLKWMNENDQTPRKREKNIIIIIITIVIIYMKYFRAVVLKNKNVNTGTRVPMVCTKCNNTNTRFN